MEEIQSQLETLIDDVERDETMTRSDLISALYKLKEQIEDWTEDYIRRIGDVNRNIDEIDYKGYFEVDDEVGQVFKQIKEEVNSLEELTEEGALDAKES